MDNMDSVAKFGVSMQRDVATTLDRQANEWKTNRSQAITRIIMEWSAMRNRGIIIDPAASYTTTEASR